LSDFITVQSIEAAGGYPVAVSYRFYTGVGTAGIQHFIMVDKASDTHASVFSGANSNPIAVALTDATGNRINVWSVTISSLMVTVPSLLVGQMGSWQAIVTQGTSPWVSYIASAAILNVQGSVTATQGGSWTVTANQGNAPWTTVTSIPGSIPVTQGGSFTVHVPSFTTQQTVTINGTANVAASQQGSWLVFASQNGSWSITVPSFTTQQTVTLASPIAVSQSGSWFVTIPSLGVSVAGPLAVTQGGSWTVHVPSFTTQQTVTINGAVAVSQSGSWNVTIPSLGVSVAGPLAVTQSGSWLVEARITQVTSPIIVQVASIEGAGLAPTSVHAIQQGSWTVHVPSFTTQQTVTINGTVNVAASQSGTWNVVATQGQSWNVFLVGSGSLPVAVTSLGTGSALKVDVVQGSIGVHGVTQGGSWTVHVPSFTTQQTVTINGTANVAASQSGSWTVTVPSLAVGQSGAWTFTQGASWNVYIVGSGSLPVAVTSLANGSALKVDVVQGTGLAVSQSGSWNVLVTQGGSFTVHVPSFTTQQTVTINGTANVAATQSGAWNVGQTGTWSVLAVQQGSWTIHVPSFTTQQTVTINGTANVAASQSGSWNTVVTQGQSWNVYIVSSGVSHAAVYSLGTGNALGVVLASPPAVSQSGSWFVTVPSLAVGQAGTWQIASVAPHSVNAVQQGSWQIAATQSGSWNVTVPSLAVGQSGTWSVQATQSGSWNVAISQSGSFLTVREFAPQFTHAKIAWEVTSSVAFPFDGSGIARSSSTATINLATDVHSSDVVGLLAMIVSSGGNIGETRPLTWANQSSREASVTPSWPSAVTSGTKYVLLIDCRVAKSITFRTEINSATGRVHGAVGLYSLVQSGNMGTWGSSGFPANVPIPTFDGLTIIDAVPTSLGITVPSFWPGEAVTRDTRGYVGGKFFVNCHTAKFSMWGAAC
jgi:hypothetical protein